MKLSHALTLGLTLVLSALAAPFVPAIQHHLAASNFTASQPPTIPPAESAWVRIRPSHTPTLCLTDPFLPDNFVKLAWEPCLSPNEAMAWSQRFIFPGDSGGSAIRLADSDVCLDTGMEPANGARVVLYHCEETADQVWSFYDEHICALSGEPSSLGWPGSADN